MRYVSIDLETTGLDTKRCQVLEAALVLEDTDKPVPIDELPFINLFFKNEFLCGEYHAMMKMNKEIIDRCEEFGSSPDDAWHRIWLWIQGHHVSEDRRAVVAGKNVAGFDLQFFPDHLRKLFHHRVIDPGSVLIDWSKATPPSLGDLLGTRVRHTALEDARDVIRVLREAYHGS